jgi:hypothetical protein
MLVALAVFAGACSTNDPEPSATPSSPLAVETSAPSDDDAFALWPEDTRSAAEAKAGDPEFWRSDRQQTALHFAAEVLGWDDAAIADYRGPIECGEGGCVRAIRPNSDAVLITMGRPVEEVWSVLGVGQTGPGGEALGLDIEASQVRAVFPLAGAASATVEVGYGADVATHDYTEDAVTQTWDLGFTSSTAGHFLILFKDADGNVIRAQGSPLARGDFTAG